jgi:DNA polymerase III alpha subunit
LDAREALWRIQAINMDAESLFFAETESRDKEFVPTESEWETLNREYQTHGYSLVRHPLSLLRPALEQWSAKERQQNHPGFTKSIHLPQLKNGARVRVAGLLSLQQRPPTAKGFAFLTLEDEGGLINVVLMPEIYKQFRLIIVYNPLLDISGTLEMNSGVINLKARHIRPLPVDTLLGHLPRQISGQASFDFKKCFDDHSIG